MAAWFDGHLKPLSNAGRWPWSWTRNKANVCVQSVESRTVTVSSRNTKTYRRTTWRWRANPASDHPCPPPTPPPAPLSTYTPPTSPLNSPSEEFMFKATPGIFQTLYQICVLPRTHYVNFTASSPGFSIETFLIQIQGAVENYSFFYFFFSSQNPLGILLGIYKYISMRTYIFLVQHEWLVTVRKAISVKGLSVWSAGMQEDGAHVQKWNTWKIEG